LVFSLIKINAERAWISLRPLRLIHLKATGARLIIMKTSRDNGAGGLGVAGRPISDRVRR
jgi:hypothetical protein